MKKIKKLENKGTEVKMKKEIKKTKEINRGITLVSLVITIVVLLILAGITINLTIGHDGIITKATQARENMILAEEEEEKQLNELYKQMLGEIDGETSYDTITKLAEFKKEIAKAITDMGVDTLETASAFTMANNIRSIATNNDASSISYDNTNSELTSTNVQGAVDELDSEIDNLNDSLNNLFGVVYKKDFSNTSFNAGTTNIDTITLPKGKYLCSGCIIVNSSSGLSGRNEFSVLGSYNISQSFSNNMIYPQVNICGYLESDGEEQVTIRVVFDKATSVLNSHVMFIKLSDN